MIVQRQSLLLVDDSKEDRFLIKQSLVDCGLDYDVEEFADGEEAEVRLLECVNEDTLPSILILDLALPKRSGVDLLENLSMYGLAQRTNVVVLSSLVPERDLARLRKLGVNEVFEKPIDLVQFQALARKIRDLCVVVADA